jgi:predicted nucleic acid-binding protein
LAEIVVADAGPLIAFGLLGRIELLPRIFEKVIVPQAVFEETQFHPALADARAILASRHAGHFVVDSSTDTLANWPHDNDLDHGEAVAIALAASRGFGILIDDNHGRAVAAMLDLKIIGTVGVLVLARQRGLIPVLAPVLGDLVNAGHYLSASLVEEALRRVGE